MIVRINVAPHLGWNTKVPEYKVHLAVCVKTDRNSRSCESEAEEHEEGNDLMCGFDIRQTQTAVVAAETPADRFENVRPLQEIHTDHRWDQERKLLERRKHHITLQQTFSGNYIVHITCPYGNIHTVCQSLLQNKHRQGSTYKINNILGIWKPYNEFRSVIKQTNGETICNMYVVKLYGVTLSSF